MVFFVRFCIAFTLILLTIFFSPLNEWTYKALMVNTPIPFTKGEVIVICSSNFPFDTPNGLPDLSTLVRMDKGIRLYREGYADKIIAFGGIEIPGTGKTTGQAMKERLILYGVPEADIIVQDEVKGRIPYYENILNMMYRYKNDIDFNKAIFVSSNDQSLRLYLCLRSEIREPVVVTGEPYELHADWGRRLHLFRRIANEILVAIPRFYITGRFSVPSTFDWVVGNPDLEN